MAALLTKYSDDKLVQIKLSITQKKDISREEIESSLQKEGLTSIADDLKDNLEKGEVDCQKSILSVLSFSYHFMHAWKCKI